VIAALFFRFHNGVERSKYGEGVAEDNGHHGKLAREDSRNLQGATVSIEDKVHGLRLHALRRAEQLGNVSAACRELGVLRTLFYRWKRWKRRLRIYGTVSLYPKTTSARPGRPPKLGLVTERVIVAMALAWRPGAPSVCRSIWPDKGSTSPRAGCGGPGKVTLPGRWGSPPSGPGA
jgi:hypothetical protein